MEHRHHIDRTSIEHDRRRCCRSSRFEIRFLHASLEDGKETPSSTTLNLRQDEDSFASHCPASEVSSPKRGLMPCNGWCVHSSIASHPALFCDSVAKSEGMSRKLRIPRPDDFHHHARDGSVLGDVLQHTAKQFRRAIIMPNLKPPVRTLDDALAYKERILSHTQANFPNFLPLMTLYLTDTTTSEEIERSFASGHVFAVKYYPAGATTNSDFGVTNIERVYPVLETMARIGMPLLIHGEVTDSEVDVFDREKEFLETILKPLAKRLPSLKIVAEHVTTAEMAAYVSSGEAQNVAATITAHHLLYNRNDIFRGGVSPHMYCLPILKRERHRKALLSAVASGCPRFFIGTDSAPHAVSAKESSCGCAGIFTAHAAIELYAEAFASVDALDRLEGFACRFGAEFYGLPVLTDDHIELVEESWTVPESYSFGEAIVRPLRAGQEIKWRIDSI